MRSSGQSGAIIGFLFEIDLPPRFQMHNYERLVRLLLRIVLMPVQVQENFVQRIGIYLLNSLACQVDRAEKELVGKLGAFKVNIFFFPTSVLLIYL